jgi:hypothetical protein
MTTVLPAGAALVAVDSRTGRVWVVGQDTNEIDGYDPGSLMRISRTQLRRNEVVPRVVEVEVAVPCSMPAAW